MKLVGLMFAALTGAALTALLWKELPAAKRYIKMERM